MCLISSQHRFQQSYFVFNSSMIVSNKYSAGIRCCIEMIYFTVRPPGILPITSNSSGSDQATSWTVHCFELASYRLQFRGEHRLWIINEDVTNWIFPELVMRPRAHILRPAGDFEHFLHFYKMLHHPMWHLCSASIQRSKISNLFLLYLRSSLPLSSPRNELMCMPRMRTHERNWDISIIKPFWPFLANHALN